MNPQTVTAPAAEPLTRQEVKDFLRVHDNTDDAIIDRLITDARETAEHYSERALITQTLKVTLDSFPDDGNNAGAIVLPRPPIQSITSIVYVADDVDGTSTTLAATEYAVDTVNGWIVPSYDDEEWPETREQINAVVITYVAGYGGASAVPTQFKGLMLAYIALKYDNRGGPWEAEHIHRGFRNLWHGNLEVHV